MHIARGADGLAQLFTQAHDHLVPFLDLVPALGDELALFVRAEHKAVVGQGLDLQVVVPGRNALELPPVLPPDDGLVQLPCFAGGAKDQALPVLVDLALGHDGEVPVEVVQIRQRDELIEIPQADLVLRQHDKMLGHPLGLAQGGCLRQAGVDLLEGLHPSVPEHLGKGHQHVAHHGRVVRSPVVVEVRQVQMLTDDVQLELRQLRQKILRQRQRIQIRRLKGDAVGLAPLADEADVKLRVVGRQGPPVHEVQKGPDGLLLAGGTHQHLVGDAGELDDVGGQGALGVYEGLEALLHFPMFQDDRTDLRDDLRLLVQARRLQVKADDGLVQVLVQAAPDGQALVHVVDVIGLRAQQDLTLALARAPGVREGLGHAVVRDGNGRVAPGDGPLHCVLGVGQGVHGGHTGVQVQLHPLLRGIVLLDLLFRRLDGQGFQDHVVVKAVQVQPPGDLQVHSGFDAVDNGHPLVPRHEFAHADGAGAVGHVKADDPGVALFQLPVLHSEHVALHRHDAHVQLQRIHRHGDLPDLMGAVNALGGKAPLLGVGLHGLLHGLLAQGLGLLKQALLLAQGRGRFWLGRRRLGNRRSFHQSLWLRRNIFISRRGRHVAVVRGRNGRILRRLGAGRLKHDPRQAISLGHFSAQAGQQRRVRHGRAEQLDLDGPGLPVHHRTGDEPRLHLGSQGRVRGI